MDRKIEYRINAKDLDIVCLDCADFLNHPCVECEDCPVSRLKSRLRFRLGEYILIESSTKKKRKEE